MSFIIPVLEEHFILRLHLLHFNRSAFYCGTKMSKSERRINQLAISRFHDSGIRIPLAPLGTFVRSNYFAALKFWLLRQETTAHERHSQLKPWQKYLYKNYM